MCKCLTELNFQGIVDALDIALGTALVQHLAPRYHPEARELFDNVLKRKPTNASTLIGVRFILEEEEEDYQSAIDFLNRALERTSDVKIKAEIRLALVYSLDRDQLVQDPGQQDEAPRPKPRKPTVLSAPWGHQQSMF